MSVVPYNPDSDDLMEMTRGYVMASRINDIVAKPNTSRYLEYLRLLQEQCIGEPIIDHSDQYREMAKELLPRALQGYEQNNGCKTTRGLLYYYPDREIHIAAAPDATEAGWIGITVHVRSSMEKYEEAVERGVTPEMERHAVAHMLITGFRYWVHINYFEDQNLRVRRLREHAIEANPRYAAQLEEAMIGFVLKSRLRAASCA